jgi:hypothetical protein
MSRWRVAHPQHVSAGEGALLFLFPWYPALMLGLEASNVIDLRLRKLAHGGPEGAAESRLMVEEKVNALFEAGSVLARGGDSAEIIGMYRKHVAANSHRLKPAK